MGYIPLTDEEIKKSSKRVQERIKKDDKKQKEDADFLRRVEEVKKAENGASDASSSAEQAEASLSQTSEAPQSTTEIIDVSPNAAPSAETKSGENRLGYIAILIILAMIFIVCLQRFFSERKIEKECDGAVRPKKESA